MKAHLSCAALVVPFLMLGSGVFAQQRTADSNVPRLVSFSGVIKDAAGKPVNRAVPVTFSLFAEQEGGPSLWNETQVVSGDPQGYYSVFLGATSSNGLPLELFTTGAARWLGVQPGVPGAVEPTRILLVGVPYALKAADADTLGGKPASAFVMATPKAQQGDAATVLAGPDTSGVSAAPAPTGSGTTDYLPLWTSNTNMGNSLLFQSNGAIEAKGPLQLPSIATATASKGFDSEPLDFFASVYNESAGVAVPQHFRWQAEPVLNNTGAPSGKLDLLYAAGSSAPAETGLSINGKGMLTFASGQTFPGTVAGVMPGTDLTGGGTSGVVTLNVDITRVPQLKTANNFTGNQSITGNVVASGSIGGASLSSSGTINALGTVTAAAVNGGFSKFTDTAHALWALETGSMAGSYGVLGQANGTTNDVVGVYGYAKSWEGAGVYGQLIGPSVRGGYPEADGGAGVWGDTNQPGNIAVRGTADGGGAGEFTNNSESNYAVYAANSYHDGTDYGPVLYAQGGSGGYCEIDGAANFSCTGTKSAVVPLKDGARKVALYAVEAPENWFEDFGSGQLSNGVARILLEPTYAQTVNTGMEYHVFLTPNGESEGLYVTNKAAQGFEVHESHGGHSNIAFDYRIVAKRKGYESIRLADKTKEIERSELAGHWTSTSKQETQ